MAFKPIEYANHKRSIDSECVQISYKFLSVQKNILQSNLK